MSTTTLLNDGLAAAGGPRPAYSPQQGLDSSRWQLQSLNLHAIACTISVPWNVYARPFLRLFEKVRVWYCYTHHRVTSFRAPSESQAPL